MKKTKSQLGLIGFLLAIVVAGFGVVVPGEPAWARSPKVKDESALKVGVYNYAHIGGLELREAEGQAGRLFLRAGVRIAWVGCAREESEVLSYPECSSRDVVLRILPASMSDAFNSHAEALGAAISTAKPERAWVASVFYDRVASRASSWKLDPGLVLGDTAAHELGHLLLGPGHSRHGIMQAIWTPEDLRRASRGEMPFTPDEPASLKNAVTVLSVKAAPLLASGSK